jgi:hypothetical protein
MAFTKFARLDSSIIDYKFAPRRYKEASLAHYSEFDQYRTDQGFLYVRTRAISSRINQNWDSWPSVELAGSPAILNNYINKRKSTPEDDKGFVVSAHKGAKYGFSTFLGKPIFVDHNNSDPSRARGVVVDAKFHIQPFKTAKLDPFYSTPEAETYHFPPTWVELLLETDAHQFPKLAKEIMAGAENPDEGINGVSMGCNVDKTECSICGNIAREPNEFCSHIAACKGAIFTGKDSKTGQRIQKKAAEKCIKVAFFELSYVFSPADETALFTGIKTANTSVFFPKTATLFEEKLGDALQPLHIADLNKRDMSWNNKMKVSSFMKGAPDAGDDEYFGGKSGAAKKAFDSMVKEYGYTKGEEVYYATKNRHKGERKKSKITLADNGRPTPNNTPQVELQSAPQSVDTLRQPEICPVCGSEIEGSSCGTCGYTMPPDSLDNPDLTKARQQSQQNMYPMEGPSVEGYKDPRLRAQQGPPPQTVPPYPPGINPTSLY